MGTDASKVRTVAIVGHGGVGKTSVADALIFAAGANNRLGKVDEATSVFDSEPEEIRRKSSIISGIHGASWDKHALTILDTPGQGNFVLDAAFAMRGAAAVVLVIDPAAPVRAETLKVWGWAREAGLPVIGFANRLDRPDLDLDAALVDLGGALETSASLVQLPIGEGESFSGIIGILEGKVYAYKGDSGKFSEQDVPTDSADRVEELRLLLMESAAEGDDDLLEKYLDAGELTDAEMSQGIRSAIDAGSLLPVLCGSAIKNIGFPQLLDAINTLLPAPVAAGSVTAKRDGEEVEVAPDPSAPVAAFVFKTIVDPHAGHLSVLRILSGTLHDDTQLLNSRTRNKERVGHLLRIDGKKTAPAGEATVGEIVAVAKLKDTHSGDSLSDPAHAVVLPPFAAFTPAISFAIEAKKRGEEDKATQGLMRLCEEDLSLRVERDESSGEILLSGAGQLHVETACERLERKYNVAVELKAPKVPYRETIRKGVKGHGRLKKQTGGHGQFADCRIEVEPTPRGSGFEFVSKIVGGAIPRGFIPAVEKGVLEAMRAGSIAGYPVVDVKVTLTDGQYHDVDSSEMAFKIAGSMAFKDALEQAKPCLLEPYVSLSVSVPDECMGDVMGDLNSRRAKVEGMEQQGHAEVIKAKAPMSEVLRYAPDLTSMTSGRGSFEMGFSHYEQLPEHLVTRIVQELQASKGAG